MDIDAQLQPEASVNDSRTGCSHAVSMQYKVAPMVAVLNLARNLTSFCEPAWLPAVTAEHHGSHEEAHVAWLTMYGGRWLWPGLQCTVDGGSEAMFKGDKECW